jgi:hypothetical protein
LKETRELTVLTNNRSECQKLEYWHDFGRFTKSKANQGFCCGKFTRSGTYCGYDTVSATYVHDWHCPKVVLRLNSHKQRIASLGTASAPSTLGVALPYDSVYAAASVDNLYHYLDSSDSSRHCSGESVIFRARLRNVNIDAQYPGYYILGGLLAPPNATDVWSIWDEDTDDDEDDDPFDPAAVLARARSRELQQPESSADASAVLAPADHGGLPQAHTIPQAPIRKSTTTRTDTD